MFQMTRPSIDQLRRFLDAQSAAGLSYSAVGASNETLPRGYAISQSRVLLGSGEAVYLAACEALRTWGQFDTGWITVWSPEPVVTVNAAVAIQIRLFGVWSLSACRVVYVIEDSRLETNDGGVRRYGFANGTLADHVGTGEERFLIEWNQTDDQVWYDLLAFSRPRLWLARLGRPVFRHYQRRFARDSSRAMFKAVSPLPLAAP